MPRTSLEHLRTLANQVAVIRACDLRKHGLHHHILKRALDRRFLTKIDRGLYISVDRPLDVQHQLALACKRVPHGVVCLKSSLHFHGLVSSAPDAVWMAIDHKARKPAQKGLRMHFVRFSGNSLAQGVVNTRIDGVPVRIYSAAKTIADCFKYRQTIGPEVVIQALRQSVRQNKCSRERLWHFAKICRVDKLVRIAHSS
jgi:predicted transcriptional regulator of viral defense system